MTRTTSIEWTDHTVNFWWGCTKVSEACQFCYAEEIDRRFGPKLDFGQKHWGKGAPRMDRRAQAETELATICKRFKKSGGPRPRIFINSMSDWLDPEVPIEWLADLLATLHRYPGPVYQLLTKRPELFHARLSALASSKSMATPAIAMIASLWLHGIAPENFWIGTTVENQARAYKRIPDLIDIPAAVRFLSCEPLLGPLDLKFEILNLKSQLHWIICGGESGTRARPTHPDWVRSLRDQCVKIGVPFFFKQWGKYSPVCRVYQDESETNEGDPSRQIQLENTGAIAVGEGSWQSGFYQPDESKNPYLMERLSKTDQHRLLDGQQYSQMPPVAASNPPSRRP